MEKKGDQNKFKQSWSSNPEIMYNHWTDEGVVNQVQFAFDMHFKVMTDLIDGEVGNKKSLEVGCGRGSLSSHFANANWDCSLLDISETVIERAKAIFDINGHEANFYVGDAMSLPFADDTFDVTFSVGLLEHFENPMKVIDEQLRVLKPGGFYFGYVVPCETAPVQESYQWINSILMSYVEQGSEISKSLLYRNEYMPDYYVDKLSKRGYPNIDFKGIYPAPMISHSSGFPFSLMPPEAELEFVKYLVSQYNRNNWLCEVENGQAFLIWFRK